MNHFKWCLIWSNETLCVWCRRFNKKKYTIAYDAYYDDLNYKIIFLLGLIKCEF